MSKVEITAELLADLKARAQKATPGPWYRNGVQIQTASQVSIAASLYCPEKHALKTAEDDATYIAAASPDMVLALIEEIERLKEDFDAAARSAADESVKAQGLEQQAEWLARKLFEVCRSNGCENTCAGKVIRCSRLKYRLCPVDGCINSWREAARKAVEGQL